MYRLALVTLALMALLGSVPGKAQFAGTSAPNSINASALPKPPVGSKVALVVFEDLGCPGCAAAHPIEKEAVQRAHVPLLRYDFPLAQHVWTFQGAVCARYLQDTVNSGLADQYRTDVFASQRLISSKDDLQQFTRVWMQRHGQQMPFVLDPEGKLAKEVKADYDLGMRVRLVRTPTIVVVTNNEYQIVCGTETGPNDPAQILPVLEGALAQTHVSGAPAATRKVRTPKL